MNPKQTADKRDPGLLFERSLGSTRHPVGSRPRLRTVLHRGWKHTRRLFHLLVGIAFLFLAAAGASQALAEWRAYAQARANGMWRFEVVAGFTVMLLIFGVYSFLKARSVQ